MKKFRFGVHALGPSKHDEWVSLARRVETLGFSVLTVPDHLIEGCMPPFAALGLVAEATSTLRVGTLVLNNDLRHPALVAREILAIDSLSGGRVELGIGAGSAMASSEYQSIGIPFDDGATRVSRLAESVAVVDRLLRGNEVSFGGAYYHLTGHRSWPPPTQRPRPPILIGGNGRRLLRIAAERADTVGLSPGVHKAKSGHLTHRASDFLPDAIDEQIAFVRVASAGRAIELQTLVQQVVVTDDPRDAAERARASLPEIGVTDILATPYLWIGTVASICDKILAARERWGFSYFTVFSQSLEAVAPIVSRLTDT
jgi:probable F420-dependent oxidoreductase